MGRSFGLKKAIIPASIKTGLRVTVKIAIFLGLKTLYKVANTAMAAKIYKNCLSASGPITLSSISIFSGTLY